jgi:hypothetical protein
LEFRTLDVGGDFSFALDVGGDFSFGPPRKSTDRAW